MTTKKAKRKSFILVKLEKNWYVAFLDRWYHDYVINFSRTFKTKKDALKSAKSEKFEDLNSGCFLTK